MKLLIYITNNLEHVYPILSEMLEKNLGGATVVSCEGMLRAISETSGSEPPPIFGSLRRFLNPTHDGKMIFAALRDEQMAQAVQIIHAVAGDLHQANAGVLFTVPVDYSEVYKNE